MEGLGIGKSSCNPGRTIVVGLGKSSASRVGRGDERVGDVTSPDMFVE